MTVADSAFDVAIALKDSSVTLRLLRALLPFESELHYAKVAGQEVIACAPFLAPLEDATQVAGIEAGSFCYWPDRAMLCCYFGISTETETVTVIGRIRKNIEGLREAGERIRVQQGALLRVEEIG